MLYVKESKYVANDGELDTNLPENKIIEDKKYIYLRQTYLLRAKKLIFTIEGC